MNACTSLKTFYEAFARIAMMLFDKNVYFHTW